MARRSVPLRTKRAMRAAHLLGRILKEYFDANLCEYLTEKSFDWRSYSLNILDNLLLVGGIPRDILLGTEVRDIDITFNLRELTKIQLNHLRKYHSKQVNQATNCRCAYWQHYLNRYDPANVEEEEKNQLEKEQMIKFHKNSFIFNARFFIDILAESEELKGKLEIKDIPKHGFISCEIVESVKHENYDLKGQKFEFTDTFDSMKVLSIQKLLQQDAVQNEYEYKYEDGNTMVDGSGSGSGGGGSGADSNGFGGSKKKSRWKSIALFPQEHLDTLVDEFDTDIKLIELEVYPIKLRNKLSCYDFSINTAIIPLSSITEFCDSEDEVNIAIWFWEYIVENGLDDIDAIRDITQNRVLRVPQAMKDLYIIRIHPTTYHFWRTIELMIRLPNFYIDTNLINAHIEDYDGWLTAHYFDDADNRRTFVSKFVFIVTEYCKNIRDVRAMLHTLEELQFNHRFTRILHDNKELNAQLLNAIQQLDNQQYLVTFSSYGYPFLFGMNASHSNHSNSSSSESAADQQKREILRLQNINLQLENENRALHTQMDALRVSKTQLAVNSAKAIDQLRSFLRKYQQHSQ